MIRLFKIIKNLFFRSSDEVSLENKLSNILMFIGALICFFGFTINLLNNIPILLNCLIGVCGIVYAVLFYLSSFKKITKPLEIPFQIVTVFVILYNWFTLQGIEGSTSNFFYIGIFALIYCSSRKNYWTTFFFILFISALLIIVQTLFPSFIIPYPDKKTQLVDIWTGFFLALISFGVLTILVKKSFDIERLKSEKKTKELKESEAKYQFIVENTNDILWLMNGNLEIEYETSSITKFLGYTVEEHMKMSIDDYMTPPSAKKIKDEFQEGMINLMKKQYDKLKNKAELEVELIRKDKSIVHARITMIMIRDDQYRIVKIRGITTDITKHKLAEEAIYRSKKDWEDTFESITDMITIHDQNYNILHVNKAGKELLKLPEFENHLKFKCYTYYHGTEKPPSECLSCNCMKTGVPGVFELYEPHLDKFLEIRAIPRLDNNSQIIGVIHVIRDITKQKQEENDLIKAKEKAEESDRLKSSFLANMSHEIRTPMNGILGFAALLKENNLPVEKQKSFIEIIEQSGQRMLSTINDIIDISKIESGQTTLYFQEIHINKALKELFNFFHTQATNYGLKLKYESELSDSDCIIETDLTKFNQVFTNLISNAIKFTKSGSVTLGCKLNNENIEFYVKDTGIGILPENREIIFERFRQGSESYTRGYEGSGLGLCISKAFVELLGGKIWVDSEINIGSTFYFSLPNNIKKPIKENNYIPGIKSLNLEKKNILLVEDDQTSSFFVKNILLSSKANVLTAGNGEIALEILKNNPDIDLILMDLKMPVLDGYRTTIEIRKTNTTIPIIAQTAFAFSEDEKKALECGCNAYISKPIVKEKLLQKIHLFINTNQNNS